MVNERFDFSTAGRIIFGAGALQSISEIALAFGKHALIVKGAHHPNPEGLFKILDNLGIQKTVFLVAHEPDLDLLEKAVFAGRESKCSFVVGFGGGAPIDTGKAVAALLNNRGEICDYLEVVGKGLPLQDPSLPYIAIPTTAGTGSEVTKNAVISIPEKQVKVSMRSAYMIPRISIIDPELMLSIPPAITASTGMDALTQVIEPYVSNSPNLMVDMFCQKGISLAAQSLLLAYQDGNNLQAREKMAYASLLGGLSLANGKLGAVHGFAGPIGGMFNAPHGVICAAILPAVMTVNAELVADSDDSQPKLDRFRAVACWLTGDQNASIQDGVKWIEDLASALHIPGLSSLGISEADFPAIIKKAQASSSMKGNPVILTPAQMERILAMSL